jgi:hypothetical protein
MLASTTAVVPFRVRHLQHELPSVPPPRDEQLTADVVELHLIRAQGLVHVERSVRLADLAAGLVMILVRFRTTGRDAERALAPILTRSPHDLSKVCAILVAELHGYSTISGSGRIATLMWSIASLR